MRGGLGLPGLGRRGVVLLDAGEIQGGRIVDAFQVVGTQSVRSCTRDEVFAVVFGEVEVHLVLEDLPGRIELDPEVALIDPRNRSIPAGTVHRACNRV